MKVIDFRFRPHTRELLASLANAFREVLLAGTTLEEYLSRAQEMDDIVRDMRENSILCAVIAGRDIETTFGSASSNDEVREFCQAYPDMFKGFVGADPHKGKLAIREIEQRVEHEGFCGVATDPLHARIYADDRKYYDIYDCCAALNIPVIITGGPARYVPQTDLKHCHPHCIDRIANDFPDLKIVVSHGAWPYVNEMIAVAWRHHHVYMELSEYELFPQSEFYINAANTILQDKIVFASAHPGVDYRDAIKLYESLPFDDAVREKIMWKNAANILEL